MKPFCLRISLPFLLVASASADVWDVGGANPDATQISDAVALAANGDVIRVWPGSYTSFVIDNKSVSVVPAIPQSAVGVDGSIVVRNLASGGEVELEGVNTNPGTLPDEVYLRIEDCQGSVRITACKFEAPGYFSAPAAGIISQASDVVLTSCSFQGRNEYWADWPFYDGGPGVIIASSQVATYRSTFAGGRGGDVDPNDCTLMAPDATDGGHGVELSGTGNFYASLCAISRGLGGDTYCGVGSDGVDGYCINAQGTYDIRLQQTSTCSQMSLGSSTLTQTADVTRRLSGPAWVLDTDVLEVRVHGVVGDRVGLFYGTAYDHRIQPVHGPLLVDTGTGPNLRKWQYLGRIGSSGVLTQTIPIRDLPALTHAKLHLVAVGVSATDRYYTNSLSPIILEPAW